MHAERAQLVKYWIPITTPALLQDQFVLVINNTTLPLTDVTLAQQDNSQETTNSNKMEDVP